MKKVLFLLLLLSFASISTYSQKEQFASNPDTLANMALEAKLEANYDLTREALGELAHKAQKNREWRIDPLTCWLLVNDLDGIYGENIEEGVDIFLRILEPSKADTFGSQSDGLYSIPFLLKYQFFKSQEKHEEAFAFCRDTYEAMTALHAENANYHYVISTYTASTYPLTYKVYSEKKREEIFTLRNKLIEELLSLSLQLYGRESIEYTEALIEEAKQYCGVGQHMDRDRGKALLHEAFDILMQPDVCVSNPKQTHRIISNAYPLFDYIGDASSHAQYVNLFISLTSREAKEPETLELIIRQYKDNKQYAKAIPIYRQLYDIYHQNGDTDKCISTTHNIAFCYYMDNRYEEAIEEHLKYDSLYNQKEDHSLSSIFSYSENLKSLAQCYLRISDTTQYIHYHDQFARIREFCLDSILHDEQCLQVSKLMYDEILITELDDYAMECLEHDLKIKDKHISFFRSEKGKYYTRLSDRVCGQSSWGEEEKKKHHLTAAMRLGKLYTYEANFDSAYFYFNHVIEHADFTQYGQHELVYSNLARLYEWVSIEPELSLQYRKKSLSIMSDLLLYHSNNMSEAEQIVMYDSFVHECEKSIEQFDLLGDQEGKLKCFDAWQTVLEKVGDHHSLQYIYSKMEIMEAKAKHYARRNPNPELCRMYCDSITYLFEHNREVLARYSEFVNYTSIGQNYYFYCHNEAMAERYLQKHEKELKQAYPQNYRLQKEYIDIQKFRVDFMHGGRQKLQPSDVAAMYKAVPEYQDEYLSMLLSIIYDTKDPQQKRVLLEEIVQTLPLSHLWDTYYVYTELIKTYHLLGEDAKIIPILPYATEAARAYVFNEFVNATEQKREWIWRDACQEPFSLAEPLSIQYPNQVSAGLIYDNLLLRKNFLLNSSISAINFIREEGDSLLIAKYNRSLALSHALNTTKGDSILNNGKSIARSQAEALVKRFNEEVMERASIIGDYTKGMNIRWGDIQKNLSEEDIAIEFSCFEDLSGNKMYAGLLLKAEGEPVFVPLCYEKDLEKVKANCYTDCNLSKLVWSKMTDFLQDIKNIYFSADGQLYNIAIESVPYWADSSIRMSERWNMYRLSSTREIALSKKPELHQRVTLYGDIRYNASPEDMYVNHTKYKDADWSGALAYVRGDILRGGAKDLPGTKEELEAIIPMFRDKKIEIQIFTADSANEESFRSLSGTRQNIIHIGTHGFYWPDSIAHNQIYFNQSGDSIVDPLMRCGLLFAGANTALSGHAERLEKNIEDGILTAKEISSLDLRGTEIVVLSACETGLGDISGEGVFGLQRGFKKAGVQTILMSLWKVHDDATRILMTSFYRHYTQGIPKHEALRLAQKEVRDYTSESGFSESRSALHEKYKNKGKMTGQAPQPPKGGAESSEVSKQAAEVSKEGGEVSHPYASPYYWAGFILLD